jgi:hypothetical protein
MSQPNFEIDGVGEPLDRLINALTLYVNGEISIRVPSVHGRIAVSSQRAHHIGKLAMAAKSG